MKVIEEYVIKRSVMLRAVRAVVKGVEVRNWERMMEIGDLRTRYILGMR